MCGIAGLYRASGLAPLDPLVVDAMTTSLVHRGPDGSGVFTGECVALGHRRLSIIDLATGDQPFVSDDDRFALVYNGELYNYVEIRDELRSLGRTFRTESDTEVILQAYQEWGKECLVRFNGMWAFALWDSRNRSLFCARDRLGEKPFFYAERGETLLFGSEIKALFAAGLPREFDEEMLDAILCFTYLPAPYTAYRGIKKLAAGCCLIADSRGVRVQRYWQMPSYQVEELRCDESRIHKEFEELFLDSVRLRMRSDVPVGAFLSGGLDSASVVAAMAAVTPRRVRTCTIGFGSGRSDERQLAQLVAQRFDTEHSEEIVDMKQAQGLLSTLAWHFDEPFGDTSALPTFVVSGVARRMVSVVLTGDGGDEVLGGYPIHQSEKLAALWAGLWPPVREPLGVFARSALSAAARIGVAPARRAHRVFVSAERDFTSRLESKQIGFSSAVRASLIRNSRRVRPAREFIEEALAPSRARDGLGRLNYWLHTVALPERYLCKVDRCSMAHSLEARVPFLDIRLVELMAGVSPRIKMPGLARKAVLRKTLGRRLPPQLLAAGKRGFEAPLDEWLAQDSAADWSEMLQPLDSTGLLDSNTVADLGRPAVAHRCPTGVWVLAMLAAQVSMADGGNSNRPSEDNE